jgi:putative ubiquitin-RnfH superfamily antitoxin RatB of RatAB toxin-antitoxin module
MSGLETPAVEVAYALPDRQSVVRVELSDGMTALAAVEASGLLRSHPELHGRPLDLGIFGRPVQSTEQLRDGDRVEIYRPLAVDPREARRRRAADGGTRGRSGRGAGRT